MVNAAAAAAATSTPAAKAPKPAAAAVAEASLSTAAAEEVKAEAAAEASEADMDGGPAGETKAKRTNLPRWTDDEKKVLVDNLAKLPLGTPTNAALKTALQATCDALAASPNFAKRGLVAVRNHYNEHRDHYNEAAAAVRVSKSNAADGAAAAARVATAEAAAAAAAAARKAEADTAAAAAARLAEAKANAARRAATTADAARCAAAEAAQIPRYVSHLLHTTGLSRFGSALVGIGFFSPNNASLLTADNAQKLGMASEEMRELMLAVARGLAFVPQRFPHVVHGGENTTPPHGEALAALHMRSLGFLDTKPNGCTSICPDFEALRTTFAQFVNRPDKGVDVVSTHAVAQVKSRGFTQAAINNTFVSMLVGDTSDRSVHRGKERLFYAHAYTKAAVNKADAEDVALFVFTCEGVVTPENNAARRLVAQVAQV